MKQKQPGMNANRFFKSAFEGMSKKEIQHQLSELLGIAPMTVYNKISGRSEFSVNQFLTIAAHYRISVDKFLAEYYDKHHRITFEVKGMESQETDVLNFLESVIDLASLAKGKEHGLATHICTQPHIFHLAEFPSLIYFKIYMYNMLKWKRKDLMIYDPSYMLRDKRTSNLLASIVSAYKSIDSIEVLSETYLTSTCNQVDYLYASKVINQKQLKSIIYELKRMIYSLEQRIRTGRFEDNNPRKVEYYINKFTNLSNMVLVEFDEPAFFAVQLDAPDVISSFDPYFLKHIKEWMGKTMDYSACITRSGCLTRNAFLGKLKGQVDELETSLL